MWNSFWQEILRVEWSEADLYASLASPGTKACDAVGGTIRPEWREGPVRTGSRSTISCGAWCTSTSTALPGGFNYLDCELSSADIMTQKVGVRFRSENSQSSSPSTLATLHEASDCRASTTTVLE